jgi:hypothetical protein
MHYVGLSRKFHFCLSAETKMRFDRGQESDRLSVRTHFLPLGHQKTRFARDRQRDVSRGTLALFIHFWLSTQLKMRHGEVGKGGPLPAKKFYASLGDKKTFLSPRKRYFRESATLAYSFCDFIQKKMPFELCRETIFQGEGWL